MKRKLTSMLSLWLTLTATTVRADCPSPQVAYAWQPGIGVNYAWTMQTRECWTAQDIVALGIDGDINAAFQRWTYAD
jgi:hypothetical protein